MKIRFEEYAHKLQIRCTFEEFINHPELKMNRSQAEMCGQIMKRLESNKLEDEWKKDHVSILAGAIAQVLTHRENTAKEYMKEMSDEAKKLYAMDNNIYLIVLDNLKVKLGLQKEHLVHR